MIVEIINGDTWIKFEGEGIIVRDYDVKSKDELSYDEDGYPCKEYVYTN